MKIIEYGKNTDTVVVFGDLPRMSTQHTIDIISWFKETFACDVCIISGKNERYPEDFDLPVNYIDWEYSQEDLLIRMCVIHLWKHYQICQMLPERYTNIIRARSDIHVDHLEKKYMSELVYKSLRMDYTLGFGNIGADKVMMNMRRKAFGGPIVFLSDYVISHKRDHIQNPEGRILLDGSMNAHEGWTICFKKRKEMDNILFPIKRVENIDNKEFKRFVG